MGPLTRWLILTGFLLVNCFGGGGLLRTGAARPCLCHHASVQAASPCCGSNAACCGQARPAPPTEDTPSCCQAKPGPTRGCCGATKPAPTDQPRACFCGCSEGSPDQPASLPHESHRLLAIRPAPPVVSVAATPAVAHTVPRPLLSASLIGRDGLDVQAFLSIWRT
jgi:hypothetical protein